MPTNPIKIPKSIMCLLSHTTWFRLKTYTFKSMSQKSYFYGCLKQSSRDAVNRENSLHTAGLPISTSILHQGDISSTTALHQTKVTMHTAILNLHMIQSNVPSYKQCVHKTPMYINKCTYTHIANMQVCIHTYCT